MRIDGCKEQIIRGTSGERDLNKKYRIYEDCREIGVDRLEPAQEEEFIRLAKNGASRVVFLFCR